MRSRAFVRSIGGRAWNIEASMPAGCAPWPPDGAGAGAGAELPYGFQKLPPVTSAISTLYDWKRASIVAMRRSVPGASGCTAATGERQIAHATTAVPMTVQADRRMCLLGRCKRAGVDHSGTDHRTS